MDTQPQALWTELSNVLNSPWLGPSRTPNHFDEQLKKSCKERPRNLWLDKGFKAWFAYIQTDQKTRSAIDSLDEPSRKEGAESLGKIIPHLTVQNLFQHILYEANRGKDRRVILQNNGFTYPESQNEDLSDRDLSPRSTVSSTTTPRVQSQEPTGYNTQPRRELPALHTMRSPYDSSLLPTINGTDQDTHFSSLENHSSVTLAPLSANSHDARVPSLPSINDHTINLLPIHQQMTSHKYPKAKFLPSVFPHATCLTIAKISQNADICITFTASECYLEIGIDSNWTTLVAKDLFGAMVFMGDRDPGVLLDSGATVKSQVIELTGANHQAAKKFLGSVYDEVATGHQYTQEIREGKPSTDFIRLSVQREQDGMQFRGLLRVQGEVETISKISKRFWPEFPYGT